MRLIDAEALKYSIIKQLVDSRKSKKRGGEEIVEIVGACIEYAPTIEAKPIIHAHWEEQNDGTHFCSRCGNDATYTYEGKELVGFLCPYCGAQMDEVVE